MNTFPARLAIFGVIFLLSSGEIVPASAEAVHPAGSSTWTWVRTGGPPGGLGYDIRIAPAGLDRMYVTDAWSGVHISTDRGLTWTPSNEGITTRTGDSGDAIPVFCLTIDPNSPDILWAGTQYQRGIFRSVDGGRTWTKMDRGVVESNGITFRGFAVRPGNSDVVYAAAEVSSWAGGGPPRNGREFDLVKGVVYQTEDGGRFWKAIWRGDNLARYVWIDPRNPAVLYISTGIFDREAANSDPEAGTVGGEGILKSIDGGQTWTNMNNGLGNLYVGSLFMHPQNPDILLAGTGNNQYHDGAGVYLTTDGGATWSQTLNGDIIEAVEFSSSDPNIAYAGSSVSIYRSEDGGHSWNRVSGGSEEGWGSPGVRAGFPIDFQVDPADPNRLFANAYGGGNFLSEDGGHTWTVASTGYTGAQVRAIAVHPAQPGQVFAAARSGIFVSYDGGASWAGINTPPARSMEWNTVAIDPFRPNRILASNNWDHDILLSIDEGATWQPAAGANLGEQRIGWRVIAFAPSDPDFVYAGAAGYYSAGTFDPSMPGKGVYNSQDGGASWKPSNDPLMLDAHIAGLAVDPENPQSVFAAAIDKGVLHSSDGGQTWQAVNNGLRSLDALSITMLSGEPATLFAGFWGGGLYRSADGGKSWSQAARGMPPEASVTSIVPDPTDPQVIYAADVRSGVYRSEDGGKTWQPVVSGLRMRAVNALAISSDGLHLYAATEGEGVYRLDLNSVPPEAAPQSAQSPIPSPVQPTAAPQPSKSSPPCTGALILPLVALLLSWRRLSAQAKPA